jgi:hypothetical protein
MRLLPLAAVLLAAVPAALAREALYVEPAAGPRLTVENEKARRRLLGTDEYCIRDMTIDGVRVFGGNRCRVKHGERKTLRLAPGPHRIGFDTIPQWGSQGDPGVPPPILLSAAVQAADKDLTVILRETDPPVIIADAAPAPPAVSSAPESSPAVSTVAASDPFTSLERLKALYDKGVVTEDEFKAKKAELLKEIR